jgi:hypothetical protein
MSELAKDVIRTMLQSQLLIEKARLAGARGREGAWSNIVLICMNEGTEAVIEELERQIKLLS